MRGVWLAACAALLAASCSTGGDRPAAAGGGEAAERTFGPREKAALAQARRLYGRGDFPNAFEQAKTALTAGRESADAYAVISRIYIDAAQDPQAVDFFTLVADQLGGATAHFYLGFHQFRLNRWDDALASFRRAAELDPGFAEASFREGLVLQARGEFDAAVEAMARARKADQANPLIAVRLARLYRITGDYDAAGRVVTEGLSHHPDDGALLHASAQLHLRGGDEEEAERLLRRAVEQAPQLREARFDLARVLSLKGDREGAAREERVYRRLTDYAEGLQSLSATMAALPGNPAPLLAAAELHLTERHWQDALRTLARAAETGADPLRVACARAEAHAGSGAAGLVEEDLAAASRALEEAGGDAAARSRLELARAVAAEAAGNDEAARSHLGAASGLAAPADRLFHLRVADAYRRLGGGREAAASERRAEGYPRPE